MILCCRHFTMIYELKIKNFQTVIRIGRSHKGIEPLKLESFVQ